MAEKVTEIRIHLDREIIDDAIAEAKAFLESRVGDESVQEELIEQVRADLRIAVRQAMQFIPARPRHLG